MLDVSSGGGFQFAASSYRGFHAAFEDGGTAVFLLQHMGDALAGGVADAGEVELDLALSGGYPMSQKRDMGHPDFWRSIGGRLSQGGPGACTPQRPGDQDRLEEEPNDSGSV